MGTNWSGGYNLTTPELYRRSVLEERLNMYDYVASGGEVLLVFLKPECDLLGVTADQKPPDTTRVDVLRIALPE